MHTREEQGIQPLGNDAHQEMNQTQTFEKQKARMEANKLRALERAAARASAQLQSQ